MGNRHDEVNNTNLPNIEQQNRLSRLPIIALAFSSASIVILFLCNLGIPLLSPLFSYVYLGTGWGALFQIIGIILGVISLCKGMKRIGVMGLCFSIISILFPFVWWFITLSLYRQGAIEMFI